MYKKFLMSIVILGALIELVGCTASFISPGQGPTAQLSERDPLIANVAIYNDAFECKKPRALYPLFAKNKKSFVTIPAGKPLTIRVITHSPYGGEPLFNNVTFIPEANQKYTVQSKPNKNAHHIYRVQILKVMTTKDGKLHYIPIHFIKREVGFFTECNDEQMKENIKRISTSYPKG